MTRKKNWEKGKKEKQTLENKKGRTEIEERREMVRKKANRHPFLCKVDRRWRSEIAWQPYRQHHGDRGCPRPVWSSNADGRRRPPPGAAGRGGRWGGDEKRGGWPMDEKKQIDWERERKRERLKEKKEIKKERGRLAEIRRVDIEERETECVWE